MSKKRKIQDIEETEDECVDYWRKVLYDIGKVAAKHNKELIHHVHVHSFKMDTTIGKANEVFKRNVKEQLVRLMLKQMISTISSTHYTTTMKDKYKLKIRKKRMNAKIKEDEEDFNGPLL